MIRPSPSYQSICGRGIPMEVQVTVSVSLVISVGLMFTVLSEASAMAGGTGAK